MKNRVGISVALLFEREENHTHGIDRSADNEKNEKSFRIDRKQHLDGHKHRPAGDKICAV